MRISDWSSDVCSSDLVTGSGKTFTVAHVIQEVKRPTLILAPNKTLAAQLYGEMKSFFPHNAVEYFVSYYDYYQPEAYVPRRSEEHTSELQSLMRISSAVFCLKKQKQQKQNNYNTTINKKTQ